MMVIPRNNKKRMFKAKDLLNHISFNNISVNHYYSALKSSISVFTVSVRITVSLQSGSIAVDLLVSLTNLTVLITLAI